MIRLTDPMVRTIQTVENGPATGLAASDQRTGFSGDSIGGLIAILVSQNSTGFAGLSFSISHGNFKHFSCRGAANLGSLWGCKSLTNISLLLLRRVDGQACRRTPGRRGGSQ